MLLQSADLGRLLLIFGLQQSVATLFLILSIITLKRKRNRISVNLGFYYVCFAAGLIINAIYVLISGLQPLNALLLTFLYFLSLDLIFSANIFILIFIINIYKMETNFSSKRDFILIISFIISVVVINLLPEGITLNAEWKPLFSWFYFIIITLFFSGSILIPTIYYSTKLYSRFKAVNLKKKLRFFLIGIFGIFFVFYGAALFNTWQEEIFRTIWSIIAFIISVPSAILIFYGIGPNL